MIQDDKKGSSCYWMHNVHKEKKNREKEVTFFPSFFFLRKLNYSKRKLDRAESICIHYTFMDGEKEKRETPFKR